MSHSRLIIYVGLFSALQVSSSPATGAAADVVHDGVVQLEWLPGLAIASARTDQLQTALYAYVSVSVTQPVLAIRAQCADASVCTASASLSSTAITTQPTTVTLIYECLSELSSEVRVDLTLAGYQTVSFALVKHCGGTLFYIAPPCFYVLKTCHLCRSTSWCVGWYLARRR